MDRRRLLLLPRIAVARTGCAAASLAPHAPTVIPRNPRLYEWCNDRHFHSARDDILLPDRPYCLHYDPSWFSSSWVVVEMTMRSPPEQKSAWSRLPDSVTPSYHRRRSAPRYSNLTPPPRGSPRQGGRNRATRTNLPTSRSLDWTSFDGADIVYSAAHSSPTFCDSIFAPPR